MQKYSIIIFNNFFLFFQNLIKYYSTNSGITIFHLVNLIHTNNYYLEEIQKYSIISLFRLCRFGLLKALHNIITKLCNDVFVSAETVRL